MLRTLLKPLYLGLRELLLRIFVQPGPTPRIPASIRSLLIIPDQRLGDLCVTLPVLQCLREAYPGATMALVIPAALHGLAAWVCRPDTMFEWREMQKIAAQEWDMVIDLTTDYYLHPAQLAKRTGAPVRIGFEFQGKGRYFNIPLPVIPNEHMQETYARVLVPLGIPFRRVPLPRLLSHLPLAESKQCSVALHPGAHHQTQRWPPEYYAELIRRIHGGGERCLVLGSETERDVVEGIVKKAGAGAMAGITRDVLELVATLQASQVLVCNNSGPLHLAGLLGVPTVSFMGPTIKTRWTPLGPHNVILRRDELPCIGCNSGYCRIRTHACMKEITPDDAFAAYLRLRLSTEVGLT